LRIRGRGAIRGIYKPSTRRKSRDRGQIERRLAAVLGADIMGYSALMGRSEEETHRRVGEELDRIIREIETHHGRVFSFGGDGLMAEFPERR
jgi:class 3 adenylate cyclase